MSKTSTGKTLCWSLRDSDPYLPSPSTNNSAGPSVPHVAASASFPPVEPNSQQRQGETMSQFFARRQARNAEKLLHESEKQRRSREQRITNAEKGAVPGRSGARVYVWEKSNGYYIRTAAGRKNYDDVWDEYGPLQRRYDSFNDEWDVCADFGPDGGDNDDDDDDDGRQDEMPYYSPPDDDDDADAPSHLIPEGEEPLEEGQTPEAVPSSLPLPAADVTKKLLGATDIPIAHPGEFTNFQIFLAYCRIVKSVSDIPRPLFDYNNPHSELMSQRWTISVRRERLNNALFYVLFEDQPSPTFTPRLYVLLKSATTTLEVVRQGWGPDLSDVIEHLVRRGIRFHLCYRSNQIPDGNPPARNLHSGLGYRHAGYIPDVGDYRAYVATYTRFLLSPRGRAAVLQGGVIGRLARCVVPLEEVLRGPTEDATIDGICLWDGVSQDAYWGDNLTPQEIDLLCGVYHIATGLFFLCLVFLSPVSRLNIFCIFRPDRLQGRLWGANRCQVLVAQALGGRYLWFQCWMVDTAVGGMVPASPRKYSSRPTRSAVPSWGLEASAEAGEKVPSVYQGRRRNWR
ncbi:hypothetical protein C8F04DRAFT_949062 [Mycena alexandri]|uniref:Uncharacterized protein n=1 Tax=Mycena alexandri TaxID=1745969 RepID=A0AAD6T6B4_9AGAR|nr:hypothetical protein C8F04DRAFT_949062 [Mycena alexandri]